MRYYEPGTGRLIDHKEKTDFSWDDHWKEADIKALMEYGKRDRLVRYVTEKYLPKGSRVLEGGCGPGQFVYGMASWGYDAYGVDISERTIEKTKEAMPALNIVCQNVEKLEFDDDCFDGYWSLGVIEHFPGGYDKALSEAARVVKDNGYLFLGFPYLSFLRRLKIKLGRYKTTGEGKSAHGGFYQYILDCDEVSRAAGQYGFIVVRQIPYDVIKGLKEEVSFLKGILNHIAEGKSFFHKLMRYFITALFFKFAGHCLLVVFKKEN